MAEQASIFPSGFVWGTSTSAYQIEGGYDEDGKGESIWDRFVHTPGKIMDGSTGDIACDHYHRWREDVGLLARERHGGYRFSISWPRVLPAGYGKANPAGLDFYSRLVDSLLAAGIAPFVTLYHWDFPQALQDQGGWPARQVADAFAGYAELLARRLGDRVRSWITLNEPRCSARLGYLTGEHAPGVRDPAASLAASHHLLLAHGMAVPVLRRDVPGAQVGITLDLTPQVPASGSEADEQAARREDGVNNRWYLDPVAGRGYPQDVQDYHHLPMPFVREGDLKTIAAPLDFLGVNYYFRTIVRAPGGPGKRRRPVEVTKGEVTGLGWEVYPDGLFEMLTRLHQEYAAAFPAFYITENGAAYADREEPPGAVDDPARVAYLRRHVEAAARAISAGVPLQGYFVWSLMDNFEWARGYTQRFGLLYVDYATQTRIAKASAQWYSRLIAINGLLE